MLPGGRDKLGLILLAAGGSTRLGKPKQTLPFRGRTLLQHAIQVGIDAGFEPVVVVLGAAYAEIRKTVESSDFEIPVTLVENTRWQEGMASSLQAGLARIRELEPGLTGVLLMVCDQPYVTPHLLRNLKRQWQIAGKGIAACTYAATLGTPALFAKEYFEDLLALKGQEGAKKVLLAYQPYLVAVPFPLGQVDIDTPEDYRSLEQDPLP